MMNMVSSLKLTVTFIIYLTCFTTVDNSAPCDLELSVVLNKVKFKDGNLIAEDNTIYKKGQYFIDDKNNTRGCICNVKSCIRKCCPLDQSLASNVNGYNCVNGSKSLKINSIPFLGLNRDNETVKISYENYGFIFGNPCIEYYISNFKVSKSGLLHEQSELNISNKEQLELIRNGDYYHNIYEYCIDKIDNETSWSAIFCFPSDSETSNYSYPGIYVKTHMFLAICFLVLFITLFFAMPVTPELKNLRGLCLINHAACSFMVYIVIVISSYFTDTSSFFQTNFLGYALYFSYFSAAIWMTVICYDILQFFKFLSITDNEKLNTHRMTDVKWFFIYSAFIWFASLLISVALYMSSIIFSEGGNIFTTQLEEESPTYIDKTSIWLFLYIPLAIIHIISVIFFRAAMKKRKELKRNGLLKNKEYRWNNMQEYVGITILKKICIVIGMLWILEVIGFGLVCFIQEVLTSFWWEYPVFILNSLRSFSIFVIILNESNQKNSMLQQSVPTRPHCSS